MDKKLEKALNDQVNSEHQAALVYTQLAYEMDSLSLSGMRDWFVAQAAEERSHAERFAKHLMDRDCRVELTTIELPSIKALTALDAFEAALAHEKEVSEEIRNIARIADEVKDLDSRGLISAFLEEQIEEEATVSEIIDQLKLVGSDGSGLLRIDADLGTRDA